MAIKQLWIFMVIYFNAWILKNLTKTGQRTWYGGHFWVQFGSCCPDLGLLSIFCKHHYTELLSNDGLLNLHKKSKQSMDETSI